MKNKILLITILFFTYSCNSQNKEISNKSYNNIETSNNITDSIFIGLKQASDKKFIKELIGGQFERVLEYEKLLKNNNKNFIGWKPNITNKEFKLNKSITLILSRTPYYNSTKDIQILLSTYKEGKKIDSITFYKYYWDKHFPNEQRFETISYIDNESNIWFLETYTSQSEISAEVNHWRKYKIDAETGKIDLLNEFQYGEWKN